MKKIFSITFLIIGLFFLPKMVLAAPTFNSISDNSGSGIGKYEKLEINFQVDNISPQVTNYQWPYDTTSIPGLTPGQGISVDAEFTDPVGQKFLQPAFFYQPFVEDSSEFKVPQKNGVDWLYPQGASVWKVRFAPNKVGAWSYKLKAKDAGGEYIEGTTHNFAVVENNDRTTETYKGFIRVSQNDPRYFEWENGDYFPALGYNMNWNHVSWANPIGDINNKNSNINNFQQMKTNNVELIRLWLSEWLLFGAEMDGEGWNPWKYINGGNESFMTPNNSYTNQDISVYLDQSSDPCMSTGHHYNAPGDVVKFAVKPNTPYRIKLRLKINNSLSGPRSGGSGTPYGLVAKIPNTEGQRWIDSCADINNQSISQVATDYLTTTNNEWIDYTAPELFITGNYNYLPAFYLALENVTAGKAYVDKVWMEEVIGSGQNISYGPNIIVKPDFKYHMYIDERLAYAFDKVVELAKKNNVYLRPVIFDKQDRIFWRTDRYSGLINANPNWDNFYGDLRAVAKVHWLQQMYWRYLQARWGYSTNIHSWELVNEGGHEQQHAVLTDEMAKYFHAFKPNDHLVSTSTWHSYPGYFWNWCPNCDFTDYHRYIKKDLDGSVFYDSALATKNFSDEVIATNNAENIHKPVIRGETGFVDTGTQPPTRDLLADPSGIWQNNFIWGGINSGGLIESNFYENYDDVGHIYSYSSNFDFRPQYKHYFDFIKDVPLNKGGYTDAAPTVSSTSIRAWGQKNVNGTNKRAHLWISNANFRWNNQNPAAVSGTVKISGFTANQSYPIVWWDTWTGAAKSTGVSTMTADTGGVITINTATFYPSGMQKDFAVKIGDYTINPSPTPTPVPSPSPAFTITQLKTLFLNWLGIDDSQYHSIDSKINSLDASWVIKWLVP